MQTLILLQVGRQIQWLLTAVMTKYVTSFQFLEKKLTGGQGHNQHNNFKTKSQMFLQE